MDNPLREEEIKTYDEIHKQLREDSKRSDAAGENSCPSTGYAADVNCLETPLGPLCVGDTISYRRNGKPTVTTVKWLKQTHMLDIVGVEPQELHGGISYRSLIEILPHTDGDQVPRADADKN